MKGVKDTSGKASQRKGADGERELAAILREYGYIVERGGSMSFGEVPDLVGLPGVHVEVKRCEQVRLSEWMQQAEADSKRFSDGMPVVWVIPPFAVMITKTCVEMMTPFIIPHSSVFWTMYVPPQFPIAQVGQA